MKLVYPLKSNEINEKWCKQVRSQFIPDTWLDSTVSSVNDSNVDKVIAHAGSIDDTLAAEVRQLINQEFGKKDNKQPNS